MPVPSVDHNLAERPVRRLFSSDGLLQYRYRGTDPTHHDNRGLRAAMIDNVPLIYLHGLLPGRYLATWPVFIVGDRPGALTFSVVVDDPAGASPRAGIVAEETTARRMYITTLTRRRLHQQSFRERVLAAYRHQCTVCRIGHIELLDAAHIIADREPEGEPAVTNGLALCKLHHAAFDATILGISPDYVVSIREDILEEHDGPMLEHGLKKLDGCRIVLPRNSRSWPDRELLARRFERFRAA